jgi:4-amino-4-deoxy-L-arabinose transferase-like glycosyltransferase
MLFPYEIPEHGLMDGKGSIAMYIEQYFSKLSPRYAAILLTALFFLMLVPYVNKAFHIDDPLFIWTAKHIRTEPLNFYGFNVNWNGTVMPMWTRTQNPPLTSYYLALASFILGWSEPGMHIALLIPALGVVAGTYFLAREFCGKPVLATIIGLASPVFLVSSTTIMSDIFMLFFWVWAVYFWVSGTKEHGTLKLFAASVLIAAACLSKYYGVSLIPMLLCYSLFCERKFSARLLLLLIPVAVLVLYQLGTTALYGQGLLLSAASYSAGAREAFQRDMLTRFAVLFSFTGGCFLSIVLFAPFLWGKKTFVISLILLISVMLIVSQLRSVGFYEAEPGQRLDWAFIAAFSLFIYAGVAFIAVIIAGFMNDRNAVSLLLFLWAFGTLVFAGFINWSNNGRSLLPLAPVFGIVLIRHLDRRRVTSAVDKSWRLPILLMVALLIGHQVALADYRSADTMRTAAMKIMSDYKGKAGTVWFLGHWGFQYYMESLGGQAVDVRRPSILKDDIVAEPSNYTHPLLLPRETKIADIRLSTGSYITTMSPLKGAGFYSDIIGPLPYAIGSASIETYSIYRMF